MSNISVNFLKENGNIYLESLTDDGKVIKGPKNIALMKIENGEYAKVENFDIQISNILNKVTDTEKEDIPTVKSEISNVESDIPNVESGIKTNIQDNSQANSQANSQDLVTTESGVREGLKERDNEVANNLSQEIFKFITKRYIKENLRGQQLLNIQKPINIFTEKFVDVFKKLYKNGNSTGTSNSALIVYKEPLDIFNKNEQKIVNNTKDELENIVLTLNPHLKDIFGEINRAEFSDELLNTIRTYYEKGNSGETESIENLKGCSEKFKTAKEDIEKRFEKLINNKFKTDDIASDCKNIDRKKYQRYLLAVAGDKNPGCIAATKTHQNLNNIYEVCSDNNSNNKERVLSIENGNNTNTNNNNNSNTNNNNNSKIIRIHNDNDDDDDDPLSDDEYDNKEGGKKKNTKTKKSKKVRFVMTKKRGKKKSKKVRFVMTKKGRKNKKNRTRR